MENVMGILENKDAQFMLLAGFIVAIGLVITTVMLNNIIFEGNMAGEAGADPVKYDVVNLMQISADEMKSAYRSATAPGTNATLKFINFSREMQNFSGNLSMIYALHGEGVNVSSDTSNWNANLPANFTNNGMAGGDSTNWNWTVIQNVSSSNITMNVTQFTTTFYINITNSSKNWTILPQVGNNLINNTMISNNISSPYSINFFNGANAYGNYSINGTASGNAFIRARDYILNATVTLSTSRVRANITIPVSVPW
jgi:hypothetical protein